MLKNLMLKKNGAKNKIEYFSQINLNKNWKKVKYRLKNLNNIIIQSVKLSFFIKLIQLYGV